MSPISILITTPMINECFGVGVTSEAMDGAAPELNPGWVHRRKNTYPEVRYATQELLKPTNSPKNTLCHAQAIKNQQTNTPSTLSTTQTIKN